MRKILSVVLWGALATLGAAAFGVLALKRGETVNAAWLLTAALCTYAIGYRFYSRFLAYRVFGLDDSRATPAERLNNTRDFIPTNKWVLFGHHFAAIAGAGPLVGPVLAAQFGYLPGTLWLVIGVVLGGAVQDFVILFASMRRDGKSLGQMAREEINSTTGILAMIAVLCIMVILLAVLALIVVNALRDSPWGLFTIACTIPIALLMGWWMHRFRPGRVAEASIIGLVLVLLAVGAGGWVANSPTWSHWFTASATTIAWLLMAYGFIASVLPVWVLLAPRDYLSTFLKIGTITILAVAILVALPPLKMPALTKFASGQGPVFAGKLFPFAFITIACGAISGFHALIASGTTPKMLARETHARMIGYGGMLMESFVGVMAMIAASILDPGVYFAINAPGGVVGTTLQAATSTITGWGFAVTPDQMQLLAQQIGEKSLLARAGGAPSLAVGMAHIFSSVVGGSGLLALWYHFAIMFEALFILTTIDAGTRVGRFMVQELAAHVWKPMGQTSWYPSVVASSALIVGGWGYFLYQGVVDPLGGINSLWPLFGISNQLLAAVALCVGTTVLVKSGRARYAWTTLLPLAWLTTVTMTAGWQKVFSPEPRLGFLAHANVVRGAIASGKLPAGVPDVAAAQRLIFNDHLNTTVALLFMSVVILVIVVSVREWLRVILRRKPAVAVEASVVATGIALLMAVTTSTAQAQQKCENAGLKLPPGFCATVFADSINGARHLVVAPNGDVLVAVGASRTRPGGVVTLRDTTRDGKADVVTRFGSAGGTSLALRGTDLYFATGSSVLRYQFPKGNLIARTEIDTIVEGLPTGGHGDKTLVLGSGNDLFVRIGSRTNSCQAQDRTNEAPGTDPCTELEARAGIWRFDATKKHQTQADGQRYATGLRNVVAMTLGPDGGLYGLQHGRDQLFQNWGKYFTAEDGAEKPAEIFVRINKGDDYGWPYCYYDGQTHKHMLAPEYGGDGKQQGRCATVKQPLAAYPGHWAPDGVAFYTGKQFPSRYNGGAFMAFHGSWNRAPLPQGGFNVVFQPMKNGAASGNYEVFADGFAGAGLASGRGEHRPVGVAVAPDGALFISDDAGGRIYRVTYQR